MSYQQKTVITESHPTNPIHAKNHTVLIQLNQGNRLSNANSLKRCNAFLMDKDAKRQKILLGEDVEQYLVAKKRAIFQIYDDELFLSCDQGAAIADNTTHKKWAEFTITGRSDMLFNRALNVVEYCDHIIEQQQVDLEKATTENRNYEITNYQLLKEIRELSKELHTANTAITNLNMELTTKFDNHDDIVKELESQIESNITLQNENQYLRQNIDILINNQTPFVGIDNWVSETINITNGIIFRFIKSINKQDIGMFTVNPSMFDNFMKDTTDFSEELITTFKTLGHFPACYQITYLKQLLEPFGYEAESNSIKVEHNPTTKDFTITCWLNEIKTPLLSTETIDDSAPTDTEEEILTLEEMVEILEDPIYKK